MGSPFDQTLGWMPGMVAPPWGDSPVPADPYPAPAPVDLAPFDQGAPASASVNFSVPPWGAHPVPDMAGAARAGADVAAQAQAVQPEAMPSEPVPGEIEVTPAESEANQLTFNPSAAPQPDSAGLVDPYPGQQPPAPQPDSIGLIDPYPGRAPVPMPTMADYEAQQFSLHGAPPDPVNVGGSTADPSSGRPIGAVGQWVGARPTDPFAGVEEKVAQGDTADLMAKAPLDPYDPGAISTRREAMAQAYANATPEERAAMDAREAALYATKRQTMEMQQAEADRKAVEDNARIAKQAREKAARDMAQLQADVQGMADSSPFEAWWSDRSTLGKLGGIVSAIFSGLANPTGPNGAIDMMMKTADADAAQKWKKIEARRQLLGEQRAANQDDATERERIRLASREQAIRMIEAQMNGLDPEGTQALALGHTIAGLRADDMRAKQAYMADQEKSAFAQGKAEVDAYNAESQRMQARAQMLNAESLAYQRGMGRGAGGGGGGGGTGGPGASTAGYGPKDKHTGAEWATHYSYPKTGADGKPIPQPPDGMNGKEANDWLDRQKDFTQAAVEGSRDVSVKQATRLAQQSFDLEHEINDEGDPLYIYGPDGKPLLNAFGDPQRIVANTPEEGKSMRAKVRNTKAVIRLLYQAKAIRDQMTAGGAKIPWSDAKQQLDVISNAIGPLVKEGTEGMSSDNDINRLVGGVGADNLKSFIDQTAKIDQGVRIATDLLNSSLRTYHYNGPPITVKPPSGPRRARVVDTATADLSSRGGTEPSLSDKLIPDVRNGVGGFLQSAVPFVGKPTRHKMTDAQKGAQQILLGDIDRPNDPDAPDAIAGAFKAATAGQNNEVRSTTAAELWKRKQAGHPGIAAYFNGMSDGEKAQFLSQLPKSQAWAALHEMNDGAPDAAK